MSEIFILYKGSCPEEFTPKSELYGNNILLSDNNLLTVAGNYNHTHTKNAVSLKFIASEGTPYSVHLNNTTYNPYRITLNLCAKEYSPNTDNFLSFFTTVNCPPGYDKIDNNLYVAVGNTFNITNDIFHNHTISGSGGGTTGGDNYNFINSGNTDYTSLEAPAVKLKLCIKSGF